MKIGIDGYILANIESEDIGYAVKQLSKDKKYYDAELIESYISKGVKIINEFGITEIDNDTFNKK